MLKENTWNKIVLTTQEVSDGTLLDIQINFFNYCNEEEKVPAGAGLYGYWSSTGDVILYLNPDAVKILPYIIGLYGEAECEAPPIHGLMPLVIRK